MSSGLILHVQDLSGRRDSMPKSHVSSFRRFSCHVAWRKVKTNCTQKSQCVVLGSFFFALCVSTLLFSSFGFSKKSNPPHLFVSYNNATVNGGPITAIDLSTLVASRPDIDASVCDGMAYLPTLSSVSFYCQGSRLGRQFWTFHLNALDARPAFGGSSAVFRHPRMVVDTRGSAFFSAGGPLSSHGNNAHVVMRGEDGSHEVAISDAHHSLYITELLLDEVRGKLWVLSMGEAGYTRLDRMDIATHQIDLSVPLPVHSAWGIMKNGDQLVVGTYRSSLGKDAFVFDLGTGKESVSFALPVGGAGYVAKAMLVMPNEILIATQGGVFHLDKATYGIIGFSTTSPGDAFTRMVADDAYIYAINSYDSIVRLNASGLDQEEVILAGNGAGAMEILLVP